ncbi:MAG: phosphate acyltransferase PlsX [Armatimonadetes bacterium]|nr:phosphate acyltransferase PlsX [Armatimonadota bacterium]
MLIAVDAMGGDHAPEQIVAGALLAARQTQVEVAVVGIPERIEPLLGSNPPDNLRLVPAESVVGMEEAPSYAIRHRKDSSLARAVDLVASGEADGVVSAGNSGAFMAMALLWLGRVAGVDRPAIATPVPTPIGDRILLDAGANMDCTPENLVQFGILGSVYCSCALGLQSPRVGLLNIGTELSKGDELTRAARELLEKAPINFIGYIEGNDIFSGKVDVVVCDGFVGNAILKAGEGLSHLLLGELKQAFRKSFLAKVGLVFMYPALRRMGRRFDYSSYGGALLLGVKGVCVVCHGRSSAKAIANAVAVAEGAARGRLIEGMTLACEKAEASHFERT